VWAAPFSDTGGRTRVFCKPGASCDADGIATDGVCTFRLGICLNSTDPSLPCETGAVARFKLRQPNLLKQRVNSFDFQNAGAILGALTAAPVHGVTHQGDSTTVWFNPATTTPNLCSGLFDVAVPLEVRRDGTLTKTTMILRSQAIAPPFSAMSGSGRKDSDTLILVCYPQ
jgi:hypothetical protein